MKTKRPLLLMIGGLVIILLAQVLNHVQVQASTEKAVTQALVSQHLVAARDLKVSMERGMGLGKPLALFNGTDRIFASLQARYEGISFLALTSAGLDVYAVSQTGENAFAPAAVGERPPITSVDFTPFNPVLDEKNASDYRTVVWHDMVLVALPLFLNQDLKGLAWLGFPRSDIRAIQENEGRQGLIVLAISIVITSLIYLMLFNLLVRPRNETEGEASDEPTGLKKRDLPLLTRVSLIIVSLLTLSVFSYSLVSSSRFIPSLVNIYERNVELLVRAQAQEFRKILEWDITPDHWKNAENQLKAQIRNAPEASVLAIQGPDGKLLFAADRGSTFAWNAPDAASREPALRQALEGAVSVPMPEKDPGFYLMGRVDQAFMDSIFLDRLLDALTVTLVSLIFSIELLLALGLLARARTVVPQPEGMPLQPDNERGVKVIRFTAFLFFLAELLPLPFLPLFISDLYAHTPLLVFQLSSDAVRGLPFSAHLFGVLIFIPIIGGASSRFSLRSLFLLSGALLLGGNMLSAFAPDLGFLMFYRLISGMGYGGVLAASTGLVVQTTSKEKRTSGFAAWGAGFAAASICAIVLGGVLATYVGYRTGMLVAAGISALLGLFIILFHPSKPPRQDQSEAKRLKFSDLFAPFRDRNALITLLFASIPVQLAFFGLFQYTLPLAMHEAGISEANIGRILTIYGLLSLGAPLLARFADRTRKERLLIIIGNLLTGLVLTVFFAQSGLLSIIFVVAAIGIGGLMFDTVISSYLSMTKISEKQGETKFLSVFLTWEKLFTVFIPVLVGMLMSAVGYFQSAAILGIVIAVGAVIFALFSNTPRKGA